MAYVCFYFLSVFTAEFDLAFLIFMFWCFLGLYAYTLHIFCIIVLSCVGIVRSNQPLVPDYNIWSVGHVGTMIL